MGFWTLCSENVNINIPQEPQHQWQTPTTSIMDPVETGSKICNNCRSKVLSCNIKQVAVGALVLLAAAGWVVVVIFFRQEWQREHNPQHEKGCSKKAKDDCQDYIEGNYCLEANTFPFYKCNCTADGYTADYDGHYCFSVKCDEWEDKYACKSHIKGNSCYMDHGVHRNCTCTASGYERIDSRRGNICWRTKCTSYQDDACHAEVTGNECTVLDDVFKCSCKAIGYKLESVREQRCILITTPRPTSTSTSTHGPGSITAYPIRSSAHRAVVTSIGILLLTALVHC